MPVKIPWGVFLFVYFCLGLFLSPWNISPPRAEPVCMWLTFNSRCLAHSSCSVSICRMNELWEVGMVPPFTEEETEVQPLRNLDECTLTTWQWLDLKSGPMFAHCLPYPASIEEPHSQALLMICRIHKEKQLEALKKFPSWVYCGEGEEELAALRGVLICVHKLFKSLI